MIAAGMIYAGPTFLMSMTIGGPNTKVGMYHRDSRMLYWSLLSALPCPDEEGPKVRYLVADHAKVALNIIGLCISKV